MDDHFWRRLTGGTLPFLVWAAHFIFCYLLAAAQCSPGALRTGGPDRVLLGGVTLVALALCAWLAWRERAMLQEGVRDKAGLLDWAAALGAVMAFVGIVWTGLPILLVEGCA